MLNNWSKINKGMSGLENSIESGKRISDFERDCVSVHEIVKTFAILSSKWTVP